MELTLELTGMCKNFCLHCSTNYDYEFEYIPQLSFDEVKNYIDRYKPSVVNLSGGEPFEHPQILDILNYLEDNKIQHNLYTTLYPIDDKYKGRFCEIIQLFKEHKYLKVVVPFHSINKTINNLFMGNKDNDIHEILDNWVCILGYKNINTCVHIVPTILNIHTLDDTIDYLINEYRIKEIKILKLVVQGRCEENKDIELDDKILKAELDKLNDKYGKVIKLGLPFSEGECVAGKEKIIITPDKRVLPCESYKSGECRCKRLT